MTDTAARRSAQFSVQPPETLLPPPPRIGRDHPSRYLPDPGLSKAIDISLLLRKPLLVTGEPGTGKTHLGTYISWKLGHRTRNGDPRTPLIYEASSTSTARDLFYTYNTLGRFHAAQTHEGSQNSIDYITYNALGRAILNANPREAVETWLPPDFDYDGPRQSLVLIDEVDKAPRDFPNDILNEVENMYFKVPEFGNVKLSAPAEMHPVLVVTSNSEKNLPGPFLRRCVYYNIPFPGPTQLEQIVLARVPELAVESSLLVNDSIELILKLRESNSALSKKPATAELLDWLIYLASMGADPHKSLRQQQELTLSSLSILIKSASDQDNAMIVAQEWLQLK